MTPRPTDIALWPTCAGCHEHKTLARHARAALGSVIRHLYALEERLARARREIDTLEQENADLRVQLAEQKTEAAAA